MPPMATIISPPFPPSTHSSFFSPIFGTRRSLAPGIFAFCRCAKGENPRTEVGSLVGLRFPSPFRSPPVAVLFFLSLVLSLLAVYFLDFVTLMSGLLSFPLSFLTDAYHRSKTLWRSGGGPLFLDFSVLPFFFFFCSLRAAVFLPF